VAERLRLGDGGRVLPVPGNADGEPSPWRAALRGARLALTNGVHAALESAEVSYVSWRYAEAFDRVWTTVYWVPGWMPEPDGAVLFETIQELRPQLVVEIGSYLGRSTVLMGLALKHAGIPSPRLVAIDPHTGDRRQLERLGATELNSNDLFRQHISATGLDGIVEPRLAKSADVGRTWEEPIDLLYVDGWHSFEAVVEDGRMFLPHLRPEGVAIFDDYRRFPEVAEAVTALDREAAFHFWGPLFGRAAGGHSEEPPAFMKRMLVPGRLRRRLTGRQPLR